MKIGLQIASFTWPGGPAEIGPTLGPDRPDRRRRRLRLDLGHGPLLPDPGRRPGHRSDARGLDDARLHGRAHDQRARLGLMVGGVHYRTAGALDQGRDDPRRPVRRPGLARASGRPGTRRSPRPRASRSRPSAMRFEMLEETLQIAHALWTGERGTEGAFDGRHYQATRLLNSPQAHHPAPPPDHDRRRWRAEDAPSGGPVRRRDQRLRRRPAVPHKYEVLREHCERSGGPTTRSSARPSSDLTLRRDGAVAATSPAQIVDRIGELSDAGVQHVIMSLAGVEELTPLETIGARRDPPGARSVEYPRGVSPPC